MHTPRAPQSGKRDLQDRVRRLGDVGPGHARHRLVGEHLVEDRPAAQLAKGVVALLDRFAEDLLRLVELTAHRPPLGAHTGVDEQ
jgi:hypothetical protein